MSAEAKSAAAAPSMPFADPGVHPGVTPQGPNELCLSGLWGLLGGMKRFLIQLGKISPPVHICIACLIPGRHWALLLAGSHVHPSGR